MARHSLRSFIVTGFSIACAATSCAPPLANPPRSRMAQLAARGAPLRPLSPQAGSESPPAPEASALAAPPPTVAPIPQPGETEPSSSSEATAEALERSKDIESFVRPAVPPAPQPKEAEVSPPVSDPQAPSKPLDRTERFVSAAAATQTQAPAAAAAVRRPDGPVSLQPAAQPSSDQDDQTEEVRDGKYLYVRNCSGCHGLTGKGDGETAKQLKVTARDFAAGGFAFGNTREALFRTISGGLPGRSVMPAFASSLSEEERWMVVDYVRTLMPPVDDQASDGAEIIVRTAAAVARGKLPPVVEDGPENVRGCLLGLPGGASVEYAIDDVRLVALRMGAFAKREDWDGRGGSYLRPLGTLVHHFEAGGTAPAFELQSTTGRQFKATGRLLETWTKNDSTGLEFGLLDPDGKPALVVREELASLATSAGTALERRLELRSLDATWTARALVAKFPTTIGSPGSLALGVPAGDTQHPVSTRTAWWVQTAPDQFALVVAEGVIDLAFSPAGALHARLVVGDAGPLRARLILLPAAGATQAQVEALLAEIGS